MKRTNEFQSSLATRLCVAKDFFIAQHPMNDEPCRYLVEYFISFPENMDCTECAMVVLRRYFAPVMSVAVS